MNELELLLVAVILVFTLLIVTPVALLIGLRRLKARVASMEAQLRELREGLPPDES